MANNIESLLHINVRAEKKKIVTFIKKTVKTLHKDGVVIGLSGGLDSSTCAYLLTEALGKDKVLGLLLPERDSASVNREHARMVAKNLGITTQEIDISDVLEQVGVYKVGPKELKTEKDVKALQKKSVAAQKLLGDGAIFTRLAIMYGLKEMPLFLKPLKGEFNKMNAFSMTKVRMRMLHLYYHAWMHNYAVIGTLDKSEFSIGLFDPHGDGACEMAILRHLYKSQIRQLAIGIGVPSEITDKPSSGDIYGNVPWEGAMGMTYVQLDQVLYGLEHGYPEVELRKIVSAKGISAIKKGREVSEYLQRLPLAL